MSKVVITTSVAVHLPQVPNYIRLVGPTERSVDVADITDGELVNIAEAWARELLAHAARRREARKGEE